LRRLTRGRKGHPGDGGGGKNICLIRNTAAKVAVLGREGRKGARSGKKSEKRLEDDPKTGRWKSFPDGGP